ncbi:hypothetical protein Bxe_A1470 [Paraburkholderia xenovorans LB400]|uniref:Uncharacterized protein n=1 Tax=Paraburkholderia xenovorans (strain LB400) TaxID=266265 RepID=Q13WQ5_PARXL|nr:hypothetical protein Bxe_A1470 [Paraburkholderia xenovorans LB400]
MSFEKKRLSRASSLRESTRRRAGAVYRLNAAYVLQKKCTIIFMLLNINHDLWRGTPLRGSALICAAGVGACRQSWEERAWCAAAVMD